MRATTHQHADRRIAGALAGVLFVLTSAGYLIGANRALDYDGAVTMHRFVRTDSLLDPFRTQHVFNNHPLFSFVEHVVHDATGSTWEVTMRLLPIAASAAAGALLGWWAARRWGLLAGLVTGAVIASHPLVTQTGREVRGYSLLLLAAEVALLATVTRAWSHTVRVALFGAALAIGWATHLYMAGPAVLLLAFLLGSGQLDRLWIRATSVGSLLGLLAYVFMGEIGRGGRDFRPWFPRDLGWELLGGSVVAVAAASALLLIAVLSVRSSRLDRSLLRGGLLAGAVLLAMVAAAWVVAPVDLYARFFLWLVPLLALAAGWAVRCRPAAAVLALLLVAGSLAPEVRSWSDDPLANRRLAAVAAPYRDRCAIGFTSEAYEFYDPSVRHVAAVQSLRQCGVAVALLPEAIAPDVDAARRELPTACRVEVDRQVGWLLLRDAPCPDGTTLLDSGDRG